MLQETLLSAEEKLFFELSTAEHVRPQGVGDSECCEMVTCGLQTDSFSQVTGDGAVRDVDGSLTNS